MSNTNYSALHVVDFSSEPNGMSPDLCYDENKMCTHGKVYDLCPYAKVKCDEIRIHSILHCRKRNGNAQSLEKNLAKI